MIEGRNEEVTHAGMSIPGGGTLDGMVALMPNRSINALLKKGGAKGSFWASAMVSIVPRLNQRPAMTDKQI